MKAIQYIKDHGVDKAREVVESAPDGATNYRVFSCSTGYTKNISISECYIWYRSAWQECEWPSKIFTSSNLQTIAELKRLVESVDLVKSYGGIINAKHDLILLQKHLSNTFGYVTIITSEKIENLEQAIADYEQIFGGEHV